MFIGGYDERVVREYWGMVFGMEAWQNTIDVYRTNGRWREVNRDRDLEVNQWNLCYQRTNQLTRMPTKTQEGNGSQRVC